MGRSVFSYLTVVRVNWISAISALGRTGLRLFRRVNRVTSSRMAVPSLEIIKVLSRFGGSVGVGVLAGLDCFGAFLEATLTQDCWGTAGGSGGGCASRAAGCGCQR